MVLQMTICPDQPPENKTQKIWDTGDAGKRYSHIYYARLCLCLHLVIQG